MILVVLFLENVLNPQDRNLRQITYQIYNVRKSVDIHGKYEQSKFIEYTLKSTSNQELFWWF